MKVIPSAIPEVLIIEPHVFGDARGYFFESFSAREFEQAVLRTSFVQDNESMSTYGVVRGLHYQKAPHSQSKLVSVVRGRVLDIAVDIRYGSPSYGKHISVELNDKNHRRLFIPRGFAHGFAVLSEYAVFQYKCDNYYVPESEGGIAWDDPALGIDWHLPAADVILSEKDRHRCTLAEAPVDFDINIPLY